MKIIGYIRSTTTTSGPGTIKNIEKSRNPGCLTFCRRMYILRKAYKFGGFKE